MAMSSAIILAGANIFVAQVTATADADAGLNIAHGLGATPLLFSITPAFFPQEARVSNWVVASIDATNINVTKTQDVGSGFPAAQLQVQVNRPHSLVQ